LQRGHAQFERLARGIAADLVFTGRKAPIEEPRFIRRDEVTQKDLDTEREIARDAAAKSGKPENIVEKMVTGKMEKFYEEVCLLEQPFIKDQTISISQLIATKIGKLGENIAVRRFARFKVGDAGETVAVTKPTEPKGE